MTASFCSVERSGLPESGPSRWRYCRRTFGISVPAGVRPLSLPLHEDFGDTPHRPLSFATHFHLENVFAPGDGHVAKMLDLGSGKLEADQFFAGGMKIGRRLQHFGLVFPFSFPRTDDDRVVGHQPL